MTPPSEQAANEALEAPFALDSVGHVLRRAYQRYGAIWTATVGRSVTSVQFTVLVVLGSAGSLDQVTLGTRAGLDKSTCGDLVNRLHAAGLVDTTTDSGDRRRRIVELTSLGRRVLEDASPRELKVDSVALTALSAAERQELKRLLSKIVNPSGPDRGLAL